TRAAAGPTRLVRGLQKPASMKPLAVAACLLLSACSLPFSLDFGFDVDQDVPEQSIPGSPIPDPPEATMQLPLALEIDSGLTSMPAGDIQRVTLDALYLDITATDVASGDADDWSFLTHVDLFIESSKSGSSLPRVQVAAAGGPGAVSRLEFLPLDVDL